MNQNRRFKSFALLALLITQCLSIHAFSQTFPNKPNQGGVVVQNSNQPYGPPPTCVNPTNGGTLSSDQSGCVSFDPALITGTSATGETGTLQYQWQSSTDNSSFLDLTNVTSTTYDPGAITATTWYRRIARVSCKTDWVGAAVSNAVKMTILTPSRRYVTVSGAEAKRSEEHTSELQ